MITDIAPRATSNCNGALKIFAFTFPLINSSDLVVTLLNTVTNVAITLAETTDYVVSDTDGVTGVLANYENGGSITTTATLAYAATYKLTLERNIPYTQPDNYTEGMPTLYQTFETSIDRLTMELQQLKDKILRSPFCPAIDSTSLDMEMPNATNRAGKYLAFDASGEPVALGLVANDVTISAYGETIVGAVDAPAAQAILGLLDEDTLVSDSAVLPPSQQSVKAYVDKAYVDLNGAGLISNLKPVVNVAVNKLDVFSKSGGAAPDATNIIKVAIPDGNGHTLRSRAAAYLSGTGQIVLADAGNYWSKGTLDGEIKTAWLYAIWDGTGIVWALAGYSGFTMVPTSTTATDDDYFLLEASSTYTRDNAHYCVAVAKIRYQYDTGDGPDHTIQTTVENSPQVIWNPRSDYAKEAQPVAITSASPIAEASIANIVVKQSGSYHITGTVTGYVGAGIALVAYIKTGSATYGSASYKSTGFFYGHIFGTAPCQKSMYLNAGDTVHLGAALNADIGTFNIYGSNTATHPGGTVLSIARVD